jgi:ADP-ribose pyrophosphatase YjhB (NUDIX family)
MLCSMLDFIKSIIENRIKTVDKNLLDINSNKAKKYCVANILFANSGNEILLLKRASHDSFHPSTYCLPGGGMNKNENCMQSSDRETYEETGIEPSQYKTLRVYRIDLPEVVIFYMLSAMVEVDPIVVLDENEHSQYIWASKNDWSQLELILDLKSHLQQILS